MKDIVITKQRQKTELITVIVCFIIAFALNVYAIITYDGQWSELFWSLGFVAVTTAILYAAWTVVRVTIYLIKKIITKKK